MPWHPLEQAHRVDEDLLYLIDPYMGPWAIVRRLRFGDEVFYRAVTFREDPARRELVGYSKDLRAVVMSAYRRRLMGAGPVRPAELPLPDWNSPRRGR